MCVYVKISEYGSMRLIISMAFSQLKEKLTISTQKLLPVSLHEKLISEINPITTHVLTMLFSETTEKTVYC